jgi:predicted RNA binding protein YcfA (HicA-like mRNA interferase family)
MTSKEVLRILKADGWYKVGQVGSHIQLKHDTKPGKVTVSDHKGDIPIGTLNSILKQAGLK